jgi:hypothetical protein
MVRMPQILVELDTASFVLIAAKRKVETGLAWPNTHDSDDGDQRES